MTRLRLRPWLRRRRPRTRGQALVELGIVLPFLVVLLAGSAQVGTIAYAQVTIDTATREGARVASENPVNALNFGGASQTFSCANAGTNAAVEAVCNASGLLDDTKLSIVITRNVDPTTYRPPADVILVGRTCRGNEALVTGSVSGIPSGLTASVQSSGGGSLTQVGAIPSPGGSYTLCLAPGTQNVSATVGNGCTGYSASASQSFTSGSTYTIDLAVQPNPTCPPTPTPTPSSSPTPTPTPAPSGTPGPTPAGSPTCSPPPGSTTQYVSVAVSYTVPVFVPFVNTILANGPNGRTITGSLTVRIEPCTITQGR